MQTRDKIVYYVAAFISLLAFGGGVYRYAVAKDFNIEQDVWCDAEAGEECFYDICSNDWYWPCTGDPADDIWVYKRVAMPYRSVDPEMFAAPCIPGETIPEDEYCPELSCGEDNSACTVVKYCDPAVSDHCYTPDRVNAVNQEWLNVLKDAGIDPIAPEPEGEEVEVDAASEDSTEGEASALPEETTEQPTE